ncbi:hypothetical protein D3C80_955370 [compost metagenome]
MNDILVTLNGENRSPAVTQRKRCISFQIELADLLAGRKIDGANHRQSVIGNEQPPRLRILFLCKCNGSKHRARGEKGRRKSGNTQQMGHNLSYM